ncbi:hypothetical protein M0R45_032675 [Rubus argutus]|uniref:Uncharacterized protein n=1 Tax=Rubus argutus TaxID=59490 RepID=A0AAW1WK03_RUBAR
MAHGKLKEEGREEAKAVNSPLRMAAFLNEAVSKTASKISSLEFFPGFRSNLCYDSGISATQSSLDYRSSSPAAVTHLRLTKLP